MNTTLFFVLIITLGSIYLMIGKFCANRMQDNDDYFLGKRGFGVIPLTLTLFATQLGGGMMLGAAEVAYQHGWVVLVYPLGACFGLLILAMGVGARLRKMQLTTIAELFEKIYGSKRLRQLASLISIITLFFILVGQGIAARKFFIALGYAESWIFLTFWIVIIAYTVLGGLRAVIYTDVVQISFIVGALLLTFFFSFDASHFTQVQSATQITGTSNDIAWMGWFLMPMMFMVIEQDMGQRCFAARSTRTVSMATALSGLLLFLCAMFPIYFGLLGRELGINPQSGGSILMSTVAMISSPAMTAIFACAMLMVIISTADSLLCAVSTNIANDFAFMAKLKSKNNVFIAQLITFLVGVSAMLASYFFNDIIGLFIHSYAFSVGILFIPVLMAIYYRRANFLQAMTSIVAGIFGYILFNFLIPVDLVLPKEIVVILLSLLGFWAGSFLPYLQKFRT